VLRARHCSGAEYVTLPAVSAGVLAWVLVWFVLGYALFAMIGALGSVMT
jgi:ABC-2 type transport system permease protein